MAAAAATALTDVTASATIDGLSNSVNYGSTVFSTGQAPSFTAYYRFAVPINASSLPTGRYAFTMNVVEQYADGTSQTLAFVSYKDVLNWSQSPFGGLEPARARCAGLRHPGRSGRREPRGKRRHDVLFWSNGTGGYNAEAGPFAFDTLSFNSNTNLYTLSGTNGTSETFNTAGQLTTVIDSDGNQTIYYHPYVGGPLTSIKRARRADDQLHLSVQPGFHYQLRIGNRPWPRHHLGT